MNETVIRAGLGRQLARRDIRVAFADEQAFCGIEKRPLGVLAGRRNAGAISN